MTGSGPLAITLFVPDAKLAALRPEGRSLRWRHDRTGGLDFILPGWWEGAHTVRLGPVGAPVEPGSELRETWPGEAAARTSNIPEPPQLKIPDSQLPIANYVPPGAQRPPRADGSRFEIGNWQSQI